jgi:Ca-dependent carbohydrate-binding module xylan-binding
MREPWPPTELPDQLVLALSEDAYQGDAQFIVKMDGTQLGTAQSVTALNSAGKTQDFTFSGTWGAGAHNVEIDFINDAFAGPGQDRNLTIDQVTYGGKAAMSQPSTLWSNGGVTIAVHS